MSCPIPLGCNWQSGALARRTGPPNSRRVEILRYARRQAAERRVPLHPDAAAKGKRALVDYKPLYQLGTRHKAGGFATVYYKATRRSDGAVVALKKPKRGREAEERLRREIDVQSNLAHPSIMPIWDADPDRRWFVMPSAEGNLEELRPKVDEDEFATLLLDAVSALAVAHEAGHVHRDLTPRNILALLTEDGGRQWVIADWGLVTRPYASGSVPLTSSGLGTQGFAAPEVMIDGRNATYAADVYSLGRIAAWFSTGKLPAPNDSLSPDGDMIHWRELVRDCTMKDPARRPDLEKFRVLLERVFASSPGPSIENAHEMVEGVLRGQPVSYEKLFRLAEDYSLDADIYLDDFARLPPQVLQEWAARDSDGAAEAACHMCKHLTEDEHWSDRDRQYATRPLSFVQEILKELAALDKPGLVEDVARDFFGADMKWDLPSPRRWVHGWLSGLGGKSADAIARVMTRTPAIAEHYGPLRPRHPGLAALLAGKA